MIPSDTFMVLRWPIVIGGLEILAGRTGSVPATSNSFDTGPSNVKTSAMRWPVLLIPLFLSTCLRAETVNVAVAISLKEAVVEVAKTYEAESGDRVVFTFGASGQLMAQIKSGAPIDAFISAAATQVDDLGKAGLVDAASRRDVAGNSLVLIVPADSKLRITTFQGLSDAGVKRVAIGEPKTVPAGQYAQQALAKLGLVEKLAGRMIYGANVRQVLSYVERGEVSAGIVYSTDAKESGDKVRVVAIVDPANHDPIRYPAVVVRASKKSAAAIKFLDYLRGENPRSVLIEKGFSLPDAPATKPAP